MAARHAVKELNTRDVNELENVLTMARVACARVKNKVSYAGNVYDCAEDVIHACERLAKEARDA